MGCTDVVAHDPSVADYRATSPRCAQGGKRLSDVSVVLYASP